MAAASFRYGMTITGAVLLVTGTLCFAWWSDGEVGSPAGSGTRLLPPREAEAVPSSSSSALLRSVSFFCCGIGGILLLFGLLWSVKANARVVSRRYQYHFPRDLQYFTAEPPEKWNCRWVLHPCLTLGWEEVKGGFDCPSATVYLSLLSAGSATDSSPCPVGPSRAKADISLAEPPSRKLHCFSGRRPGFGHEGVIQTSSC
uniref:Transmembrane protein 61 n=1 Tax=Bubo bubo TaxID=30461 RepID=A0A8C0EU10_BUBBB